MLHNAYFLAKIGADTAENEQHFAEILLIGRRVAERPRDGWGRRSVRPVGLPCFDVDADVISARDGRAIALGDRACATMIFLTFVLTFG